jgi:2-polyprenyl-6-methoxyphenol hydroxylase-like FAD-dependent oxidoreductase
VHVLTLVDLQGTSSALVGAYVLAGELASSPNDVPHALSQYEKVLRPFINSCQQLPPGAPQIACPQTALGVGIFNTLAGIASSGLARKIGSVVSQVFPRAFTSKKWPLPEYDAFAGRPPMFSKQ